MKCAVLFVFLMVVELSGIGTYRKATPPGFGSPLEKQLIQIDQQWGKATTASNINALSQLLSDDFIGIGSQGEITNKQNQLDNAKTGGGGVPKGAVYSADEYKIEMLDSSIALMVHRGSYKTQDSSETHRSLHVFVKRNGRWQVVASDQTAITED